MIRVVNYISYTRLMNDPNKRPQALLEQCLLYPVLWWGHAEDGVCDPGLGWLGWLGWLGQG